MIRPAGEKRDSEEAWRRDLRERVTKREELRRLIRLSPEEWDGAGPEDEFPFAITRHLLGLMDPADPCCPIRRQFIPSARERNTFPCALPVFGDEEKGKIFPWLFHRYPGRAMLFAGRDCAAYCRFCAWRRWGENRPSGVGGSRLRLSLDYLRRHPEINEVILSGGDPFLLGDEELDSLLSSLRALPGLGIIRAETRIPTTLPRRATPGLVSLLRRHQPLWVVIHVNHPREVGPEFASACRLLADAGVPLAAQTVLLKGINDDPATLERLFALLLTLRLRPYVLFHCRPAPGLNHFQTTIQAGLKIMEHLRRHASGLSVPAYVVDIPGGGGKIPLGPNYILNLDRMKVLVRTPHNSLFELPQPMSDWDAPSPIAT
ncbi:MAG: KamA family radical SAM protein [Candidatus Aureabacteria bacterium]|nr:KamA family radical SAM protein [Candidatus Auribacterota bacterium]